MKYFWRYLHTYVYSKMVQLTKYWVSTQLFRFTSEKKIEKEPKNGTKQIVRAV